MKTSLRLLVCLLAICSISTFPSFGKNYTITNHSITVTKFDSLSTVAIIQLINHDSTTILQVKWQIISDGFSFSGWTYSFCDLSQCYVTTYPASATDPLAPKTDGAFNVTVSHFNNIVGAKTMVLKVWDPSDPNNPDTVSMTIDAVKLNIENSILPSSSISLFPNPAKDYINLEATNKGFQPLKTVIFNSLGKTISEQNITGSTNRLPVYDLPNGIYIISLRDQYGREARKQFVKE